MSLPDVVALLRSYLVPIVDPTPVVTRVPRARPAEFVQLRRVGGSAVDVRDLARIDVLVWAQDEPRANLVGSNIRGAVWALAGTALLGPAVYTVAEFMAPRMTDDPETGTPLSWATYELAVRADQLIYRAP